MCLVSFTELIQKSLYLLSRLILATLYKYFSALYIAGKRKSEEEKEGRVRESGKNSYLHVDAQKSYYL